MNGIQRAAVAHLVRTFHLQTGATFTVGLAKKTRLVGPPTILAPSLNVLPAHTISAEMWDKIKVPYLAVKPSFRYIRRDKNKNRLLIQLIFPDQEDAYRHLVLRVKRVNPFEAVHPVELPSTFWARLTLDEEIG